MKPTREEILKEPAGAKIIPVRDILNYEVRSSWWASWIGWSWGQDLASKYFAWNVRRKHRRYAYWMIDRKSAHTTKAGSAYPSSASIGIENSPSLFVDDVQE